ncbi:unnamed protein product [Didymodactylos carnosus]|uniref:NAD(+)--protein-arginine ADP-ribosyltransferase n=1 Tax=Didymodactylos carnosus TaxID=1234261 RepID=A0A814YPM9_9BILA|nr:unnamed protein product [Didymodactylos carnosus]CAF1231647.1 unnamed protein product [Didymodactylos carnosus]CAF3794810.1 unnamed protein product [Didymodactylos carnosus]CAF3994304.1 unnamed protein product [Didymodactylos carnosus]
MPEFSEITETSARNLYKESGGNHSRIVYRGQLMSKTEFGNMKTSTDKLISTHTFLSTTTNIDVAKMYSGYSAQESLLSVPFEIEITSRFNCKTALFASIEYFSQFQKECKILFTMNAVFRLISIEKLGKEEIWQVKLLLVERDNELESQHITTLIQQRKSSFCTVEEGDYQTALEHALKANEVYESLTGA